MTEKVQEKVTLAIEQQMAVITLNNPPVNALDAELIQQLDDAVAHIAFRDDIRAVIVTGAGDKAFVAGADIRQFPELDKDTGECLVRRGQDVFNKLSRLPFPVIAAVNGFALGGGCELALACDIRVVAENAKLGLPEVGLAIIPGYGGTQRLARLVGTGKAKELIFTADLITAAEAYRIGLAELLAEQGKVMEEAKLLARRILGKGPLAVAAAKKAVDWGIEKTLVEGLELESNLFGNLCESEDKNEGARAFLEKREPIFRGK